MSETPLDPNLLADELDRVLPPGQAGQVALSNDPLVQAAARLSAIPRPTLSTEALIRIQTAVMTSQPAAPVSRSLARRFLRQSTPIRAAVAAIFLIAVASGAIFAARLGLQRLNPPTLTRTSLTSPPPSVTVAASTTTSIPPTAPIVQFLATEEPSLTPTLSPTIIVPSATPTTAPTTVPFRMIVPTATPTTAPATATPTLFAPTATPEPTLPITLTVEGPIQSINGTTIVIFDLNIVLSASDVATVKVGDLVRVEGNLADDGLTIIAVRITIIRNTPAPNPTVEVNPSTGEVWIDSGNCSNPPPSWATANGWRHRCQGAANPGNSGDNGNGNGNGNGMGEGMGS